MASYSWDSKDYEKHSRAQQKWAQELIGQLALKGSEKLLDIGCGDGKITAEIAALLSGGSVIGVDSSESMVELAQNRYSDSKHPNLSFRLMDAVNLLFESSFDVVFSNAALHWVQDHRPVVSGIFSCLKPGGRVLLQMGGKGNAQAVLNILEDIQVEARYRSNFDGFEFRYGFLGTEEYQKLMDDAGFVKSRVELINKDMVHEGREGLEGWIRTTWLPYTQRIPENDREAFIGMLASRYLEVVPLDHDGKAHVAMVRLEVEAEKSKD